MVTRNNIEKSNNSITNNFYNRNNNIFKQQQKLQCVFVCVREFVIRQLDRQIKKYKMCYVDNV